MFEFRRLALIAAATLALAVPASADTAFVSQPGPAQVDNGQVEAEVSIAPPDAIPTAMDGEEVARAPAARARKPLKRTAMAADSQ